MKDYVCVIGGANIDITGTSYSSLNPADSNPGKTTYSLGGVGRNIGENLSRLGINVEMITVLGNDTYAKEIIESCEDLGIRLTHTLMLEDERTSSYLCINDHDGEMALAISDMDIYTKLTPQYFENIIDFINNSKVCVVDTNIHSSSFEYLMDNVKVPIFLDTVSTKKTRKIRDIIKNVYALKPNILEAEILSGIKIENENDLDKASDIILDKGIENLYISMGPRGIYYANKETKGHLFPPKVDIKNTTGAGDTFMAGVAWAYLRGHNIVESTKVGMAASAICISSESTISEDMSIENINKILESMEG